MQYDQVPNCSTIVNLRYSLLLVSESEIQESGLYVLPACATLARFARCKAREEGCGTSTTPAAKDILLCQSNLPQGFFVSLVGSNVTFPSLPMLAVLIRGALIVTGKPALGCSAGSFWLPACERVTTGCMSAISLTSSDVSTSRILAARVWSRIVVGPRNCKNSWQRLKSLIMIQGFTDPVAPNRCSRPRAYFEENGYKRLPRS